MSWANPGFSGLILIVIVLLFVFGPRKLPEIGKAFGRGLREFKDATRGMMEDNQQTYQEACRQESTVNQMAVEPIRLKTDEESTGR